MWLDFGLSLYHTLLVPTDENNRIDLLKNEGQVPPTNGPSDDGSRRRAAFQEIANTPDPDLMSDALDDCRPDFVITCNAISRIQIERLFSMLCSGFGVMSAFVFQCDTAYDLDNTVRLAGAWTPCRHAGDVLVALGYTVVCGEGV